MTRDAFTLAWSRVLLAVALFTAAFALADVAVPPLKARVTDLTGTLSAQQQATLEQTLAAFEQRKGSQIAVLLVPTTQPESVEEYAVRVEEKWKLGRKGVDDGALLLIAKNDRKLRIEVGYGLEGVLNDATAKRIIADDITPLFKQGDFYGGITAGVDRMIKVMDGEPLPPPKPRAQSSERAFGFDNFESMIGFGFLLIFVFGSFFARNIWALPRRRHCQHHSRRSRLGDRRHGSARHHCGSDCVYSDADGWSRRLGRRRLRWRWTRRRRVQQRRRL